MDGYETAPAVATLVAAHKPSAVAPESRAPASLPVLRSGTRIFASVDDLLREVRALHDVSDLVVTPHKSKYAARIMMTDILAILRPLTSDPALQPEELRWVTEQQGRIEYLNGVNHIEAEETSAGEKMLVKAMIKFKDNFIKYPFDVMDGYNHLGIVWSNRAQHGVSHAFLMQAQQAFLALKKLRASAIKDLPDIERNELARRDKIEQEMEAPPEEEDPAVAAAVAAAAAKTATAAKPEEKEEKSSGPAAAEESKTDAAAPPATYASSSSAAASGAATAAAADASAAEALPPQSFSLASSHAGFHLLPSPLWQQLEVTHTLTLFFLAQVFGHLKKRDLAAVYCHLVLNRQLKQRKDFNRREWVTNAIGLSFYYSGRKLLKQAHHCLLAASHFVRQEDMPRLGVMNTPTADTTKDQQLAADLCRAWGAFYLKWLQRSRDQFIETSGAALPDDASEQDKQVVRDVDASIASAAASSSSSSSSAAASAAAAASPSSAGASSASKSSKSKDDDDDSTDDGPLDPSTNLSSLPAEELAELKRLQRLDRERERHFEEKVEDEADEDEDDLFGDLRQARVLKPERVGTALDEGQGGKVAKVDRTLPSSLTPEESQAVREELSKNAEDNETASTAAAAASASSTAAASADASATAAPAPAAASSAPLSSSSTHLLIEFKSLGLGPSPACVYATSFGAARALFKQSLEWFTRASMFYILDGYVSDHIPIQQDISLLYKLLAVFDSDLSRQCKMHKRRLDLLSPIYSQLSLASYQEFFQQLVDELASTTADMMDLKILLLSMKAKYLGPKVFTAKKRDAAQAKINELALKAVQFYAIWLQSWSKDGKEVATLDEYYHRWYLMAMFKIARCYSKVYHSDAQVLNQFIKKSLEQYKAVVAKAEAWKAEACMPEELALCREMIQLLPFKMDRVVAKGGFKV